MQRVQSRWSPSLRVQVKLGQPQPTGYNHRGDSENQSAAGANSQCLFPVSEYGHEAVAGIWSGIKARASTFDFGPSWRNFCTFVLFAVLPGPQQVFGDGSEQDAGSAGRGIRKLELAAPPPGTVTALTGGKPCFASPTSARSAPA